MMNHSSSTSFNIKYGPTGGILNFDSSNMRASDRSELYFVPGISLSRSVEANRFLVVSSTIPVSCLRDRDLYGTALVKKFAGCDLYEDTPVAIHFMTET